MTDNERIGANLAGMGAEVRHAVTPPPAGAVRRRAERQQRVRRTGTAVLAAAAVLGIAVGAISVVRNSASPPPPPGVTRTPAPSPSPSVKPTPKPWPNQRINDPIARTDWRDATITLPAREGCPSGRVRFRPKESVGQSSGLPRAMIGGNADVVYGDLTGDGRPEAIMWGQCQQYEEDSGDGADHLLAVTRDGNQLRALDWVGLRGSLFPDFWVEDGVLYTDIRPWHAGWHYTLGSARAYRWTGGAFTEADASRYRGLAPNVPVDLTPLSGRTGCPTPVLSFDENGRATVDGVTLDLEQPLAPDSSSHLVDLDGDGVRRVLGTITCERGGANAYGTSTLVVLERRGDGWVALDAIRLPDQTPLINWTYTRGVLSLDLNGSTRTYIWDGERFHG